MGGGQKDLAEMRTCDQRCKHAEGENLGDFWGKQKEGIVSNRRPVSQGFQKEVHAGSGDREPGK